MTASEHKVIPIYRSCAQGETLEGVFDDAGVPEPAGTWRLAQGMRSECKSCKLGVTTSQLGGGIGEV